MDITDERTVRLSKILKPFYYLFFAILLEMVSFLWLHLTVTGHMTRLQVFPTYFLFDLSIMLIAAGIIYACPRFLANIFYYLFLGLQIVFNVVNATLYMVYGDLFTFDMIALGGEAADSLKAEFIDFKAVAINVALLVVIILVQVLIDHLVKKKVRFKKRSSKAISLAALFGFMLLGSGLFGLQVITLKDTKSGRVIYSDEYLWDNAHLKIEGYKKFGTYGFYISGLSHTIKPYSKLSDAQKQALLASVIDGQVAENPNAPLYGDNLIMVLMESFEWFAIDPYNTPTLYEMKTQTGVAMTNFYARNKTNTGEDISIMGNMPNATSIVKLADSGSLGTGYSLPSMFREQGYTANFFHSFKKEFYEREKVNTAMGFEKVYDIADAELENKSMKFNMWNLDSDYITAMLDKFIPEGQKFMSYFTTVTTHGTYEVYNPKFDKYYTEYDKNLENYKAWLKENGYNYPTNKDDQAVLRQYKCAAMDTDRMVKVILDDLDKKGIKDNTTLVLFADHDCFYEDLAFKMKGTGKMDFSNTKSYNVPLLIYSSKLSPWQNQFFCNTYDIYPTVCELFGLPYTTALTHGYSVFSSDIENSLMVSYLSGIFNDKIFSLNGVDLVKKGDVSESEIEKYRNLAVEFFEKQEAMEKLYAFGLL